MEKTDKKREIVKAGKWRVALVILILFSTGFGVVALVEHSGYLIYDNLIANQWTNSTNLKFTNNLYYGVTNRTDVLAYPEQAASYVVWVDGATYYAKNGHTGQINYRSTNASAVFEYVYGVMTTPYSTLVAKGGFKLDTPIFPCAYSISDFYQANFTAIANMNYMVQVTGGKDHVTLKGGTFDGNKTSVSTGGITFVGTAPNLCDFEVVQDIVIQNVDLTGFYAVQTCLEYMNHVFVKFGNGQGFNFTQVTDSQIYNLFASGVTKENVVTDVITACDFAHWYMGGTSGSGITAQTFLKSVYRSFITDIRTDYSATIAFQLENSQDNNISQIIVTDSRTENKIAVHINACQNNTISNVIVNNKGDGTAKLWDVGIYFNGGSVNNTVIGANIRNTDGETIICHTNSPGNHASMLQLQNGFFADITVNTTPP